MIPDDPKALLTRDCVATALTTAGFPTAASTLATMACRGGGPEFKLYGRTPIYEWGTSLDWAKARLRRPKKHNERLQAA